MVSKVNQPCIHFTCMLCEEHIIMCFNTYIATRCQIHASWNVVGVGVLLQAYC
jgi:hypothetical protein